MSVRVQSEVNQWFRPPIPGGILMFWVQKRALVIFCVLPLILATVTGAQTGAVSPAAQAADELFQAKNWAQAAAAYQALTASDPGSGRYWNRLGYSRHMLGDYKGAVEAYSKAVAIGKNPQVMYNLACSHARLGDNAHAIEWLDKALALGFGSPQQMSADPDLESLRGDPGFKPLMERAAKITQPCVGAPEHRQFDFWIGEWSVKTPQGQPAGDSSIQLILGDCVLLENWTGLAGGSGKSFNFYNPAIGKWQQTWVDSRASVTEYKGEFSNGEMRFLAESATPGGGRMLQRLTFFNQGPDQVRQLGENSTDDGVTWNTGYDLTYFRKK